MYLTYPTGLRKSKVNHFNQLILPLDNLEMLKSVTHHPEFPPKLRIVDLVSLGLGLPIGSSVQYGTKGSLTFCSPPSKSNIDDEVNKYRIFGTSDNAPK